MSSEDKELNSPSEEAIDLIDEVVADDALEEPEEETPELEILEEEITEALEAQYGDLAPNDPFAPAREEQEEEFFADIPDIPVVSAEDAANPEIGGDIEVDRVKVRKNRHIIGNFLATVVVLAVIAAVLFCGWLYIDDEKGASCHVPQGVTLDGDPIGGLSAAEVESRVNAHVVNGTAGGTVLMVGSKEFSLEYAKMGNVDVKATVNAAMATIEPSIFKRCLSHGKQILGLSTGSEKEVALVTVCKLSGPKVKERIQAIAEKVNKPAKDAGYTFKEKKRKPKAHDGQTGYKLDVGKTVSAVIRSCESGLGSVNAVGEVLLPKKTNAGQAIFVDTVSCHLYFYVEGKLEKDYYCSPGIEGYETPVGDWYLKYKNERPVWRNPGEKWSKKMPKVIEPGAKNPYGLRALLMSCGNRTYIHGTSDTSSIGAPATHGGVALANEEVVELFDVVEVGIPIYVR